MSRRGNGEGSVYKRASDSKWVGAAVIDGRRRVVYGRTQRQAREKLRALLQESADGLSPDTAGLTLGAFLGDWTTRALPAKEKAGRLASRTVDSYVDTVAIHIAPYLGRHRLRDLRPSHLRDWLSELQDAHQAPRCSACAAIRRDNTPTVRCAKHAVLATPTLSTRSVRYAHAVLRAALSDAVNEQLVGRNVAMLVDPPVAVRRELTPLSVAEATRLIAAAADDRLRVLWLTLLALGLRRGEALGLRWEDLDFDAGTIQIRRSLQRARTRDQTGPATTLVSSTTKTGASMATIAVPAALVDALRAHRLTQRTEAIEARLWLDPGLVFATAIGTPLEPRNVDRSWKSLCERARVRPLRVHDLRHATASFLLAQGVDTKVIQQTLRHSRHATTADIYAHVTQDLQRKAADAMNELLNGFGSSA